MNRNRLALAAVLSIAAVAAHAETPDPSGQVAAATAGQATRAQVQSQLADYKKAGVNPWSTSYNPLASFRGESTREQVRNEFLGSRDAVNAMTGEDSGSAYLAARRTATEAGSQFAGQPFRSAQ